MLDVIIPVRPPQFQRSKDQLNSANAVRTFRTPDAISIQIRGTTQYTTASLTLDQARQFAAAIIAQLEA